MRISTANYCAYVKSTVKVSAQEKTVTVPTFSLFPKVQEDSVINKKNTPIKQDVDSIITKYQEDITINKMKSSSVSADPIPVTSCETADIDNEDLSAQYKTPESIYDIPNSELKPRLDEANRECRLLNTEGMTKVEIYNHVQSIFKDYLGKDYLEPFTIYNGGFMAAQDTFPLYDYNDIYHDFDSTLQELGVINVASDGRYDKSAIIEAKGYKGMSQDQIRSAVRSNYPRNMTLKDCLFMSDELKKLGLETTDYGYCTVDNIFMTLAITMGKKANTDIGRATLKETFDFMLEKPADFDRMKEKIESYRTPQGTFLFSQEINQSVDEELNNLLLWVGGNGLYDKKMLDNLMKLLESERE